MNPILYSKTEETFVTTLISVVSIVRATGEAIYNELKKVMESVNVKRLESIGLSCNRASANVGEHRSSWSWVKIDSPEAFFVKCTASECVPSDVGYLISKILAWYGKFTLRGETYEDLFRIITMDDEEFQSTMSFVKYAKLR